MNTERARTKRGGIKKLYRREKINVRIMMIYGRTVFSRNNSHKRNNFRKRIYLECLSFNFETTRKGGELNRLKIYKNFADNNEAIYLELKYLEL